MAHARRAAIPTSAILVVLISAAGLACSKSRATSSAPNATSASATSVAPVVSASSSTSPTPPAVRSPIWDADRSGPIPGITYQFSEKRSTAIIAPLFPKRLPHPSKCPSSKPTMEDARKNGQVVPVVVAEIEGSFTRANVKQVLDLVATNECGDPSGTTVFGVFESAKLVAHGDFPAEAIVAQKVDIDADGRDELLLGYQSDSPYGVHAVTAKLARVDDALHVLQTIGEVYRDSCAGSVEPKQRGGSSVVLVETAGRRELVIEPGTPSPWSCK